MTTRFIVNPRSAGGRTLARMKALQSTASAWFDAPEWLITEHAGHATDLAARAGDVDQLVVVGGDGTVNEVVNGLARLSRAERPTLGLLPAGTGSDLARTLGMPTSDHEALRLLAQGPTLDADWNEVTLGERQRISFNVAGFGLSGEVVRRVNRSSKRLGGTLSFGIATLRALATWGAPTVHLRWTGPDGPGAWSGPIASVFVANGQFCGGGMHIAPKARLDSGHLQLVIVPETSLFRSARHLPDLYNGSIETVPHIVHAAIHDLEATSECASLLVDLDGEQPGTLPLRMTISANALRVRAPFPR